MGSMTQVEGGDDRYLDEYGVRLELDRVLQARHREWLAAELEALERLNDERIGNELAR